MRTRGERTGRAIRRAVGVMTAGVLAVVVTAGTAQANDIPTTENTIANNQELDQGGAITSTDGNTRLVMQTDGNLVMYHTQDGWASSSVVWTPNTMRCGARVVMQQDGNLVVYSAGNGVCWSSNTQCEGAKYPDQFWHLTVEDDPRLVIWHGYDRDGHNGAGAYGVPIDEGSIVLTLA